MINKLKIFGKEIKLFDFNKDGKGVKKEPEGPKNLKNFFKYFGNKFTRLVTVNMYYIFGNSVRDAGVQRKSRP